MRPPAANNINHLVSSLSTEVECPACDGTEFSKVRQPDQAGRKIYPAPCQQCLGKGRIASIAMQRGVGGYSAYTSGIFDGGWRRFIPAKSGRSALSVWFATNEPSQAKAFENSGIPRNPRAFINIKFNENVPVALAEPTNEFDFLLSATFW